MGQKRFAGDVWFENQVDKRTRAALRQQGEFHTNTAAKKQQYAIEYKRQEAIFRKERQAKKAQKQAKFQAREQNRREHQRTTA